MRHRSARFRLVASLAAASCWSLTTPVQGQETQPADDPDLTGEIIDRTIDALDRPRRSSRVLSPATRPVVKSVRPGLPVISIESGPGLKGRVWREGTFLPARSGVVQSVADGIWIFRMDAGERGPVAPVVIMPCSFLDAIERIARAGPTRMTMSGRIFQYHTIRYFLPLAPPTLDRGIAVTDSSDAAGSNENAPPTEPPADNAAADADLNELVSELESIAGSRRAAPASDRTAAADADAPLPGQAESNLPESLAPPVPEGAFLASRSARVVRDASGHWMASFDGEIEGWSDAPMFLLPCMNLMAIERIAENGGEGASFLLSGHVFVHDGVNHLLPTMFVRLRPSGEVIPVQ